MTDVIPQIGMGVTVCFWSDRAPFTIINISKGGKKITLQADKYHCLDSKHQRYIYQPDPNGRILYATLRKDNKFKVSITNNFVFIGRRQYFYDYSF